MYQNFLEWETFFIFVQFENKIWTFCKFNSNSTCHSITPCQSESKIKFHQLIIRLLSTGWDVRHLLSILVSFLSKNCIFTRLLLFFSVFCCSQREKTQFNFGGQENFLTTQWSDFFWQLYLFETDKKNNSFFPENSKLFKIC